MTTVPSLLGSVRAHSVLGGLLPPRRRDRCRHQRVLWVAEGRDAWPGYQLLRVAN